MGQVMIVCLCVCQTQLHVVWEEVEKKRRECEALRQELETVQRNAALSSVLDVQVLFPFSLYHLHSPTSLLLL